MVRRKVDTFLILSDLIVCIHKWPPKLSMVPESYVLKTGYPFSDVIFVSEHWFVYPKGPTAKLKVPENNVFG